MLQKITIIGSGAMGTAIGTLLMNNANNNQITIYGIDIQELEQLKIGQNLKYFPPSHFLPSFVTTNDLKSALDQTSFVVIAVPSKFVHDVFEQVLKNINSKVIIVNVSKGFEPKTTLTIHAFLEQKAKTNSLIKNVVSLFGPSHAEDIVNKSYMALNCVTNDKNIANQIKKYFCTDYCQIFWETDVIGAEIGSSYKNILAILAGALKQQAYSINTIAAVLTLGMQEAGLLVKAMNGNVQTLMGLTGLGDLLVTAFSPLSRNWQFGFAFGENPINAFKTTKTVEGLVALKTLKKIANEHQLHLPLIEHFNDVIERKITINKMIYLIWNQNLL